MTDRLGQLRDVTVARDVSVTAIAHGRGARVRSYELIAQEWNRRG